MLVELKHRRKDGNLTRAIYLLNERRFDIGVIFTHGLLYHELSSHISRGEYDIPYKSIPVFFCSSEGLFIRWRNERTDMANFLSRITTLVLSSAWACLVLFRKNKPTENEKNNIFHYWVEIKTSNCLLWFWKAKLLVFTHVLSIEKQLAEMFGKSYLLWDCRLLSLDLHSTIHVPEAMCSA